MTALTINDSRHIRALFFLSCYAFIGTVIFFLMHCEHEKSEEKRQKMDKMIRTMAEKVAGMSNDRQRISLPEMKQYVEQAYMALRQIDDVGGDSHVRTQSGYTRS
ncbi:unnamed protein product [Nippostrongylus brasiliensis]|uniref:Cache_2 domain-containing protein n=1 Tax=Nippostrongylus brasiliensis TaxID=27835 RepID=A0A0N4XHC8_NIPBR|nr:unnamed protein product [Nippostrongylus brasiliensis]